MASYEPTIGIECHVQLKTKTKLFSAVSNEARDAEPNTLISHICLGMPGALPVLNKKAVELAVRAAFAFNTMPQKYSYFERKHYFYADLPKGYQITQLTMPIIVGGYVEILVNGVLKTIRLNRVQLEEDAGKSTHPVASDFSLVDLNRAGTPLLEIVSEPDMHSAEEAKAYARELWLLTRYAGISEADLYHGNMRFDVNVSLSSEPGKLGVRTETKNLNSFKAVEKAVEYEIARQKSLLDKGRAVVQETLGWDDAKQKTFSQRTKEDAHDYRYFPDPDLPPIELEDVFIGHIKKQMPVGPKELRVLFRDLGLADQSIETLVEAITPAQFLQRVIALDAQKGAIRRMANWLVTDIQSLIARGEAVWEELKLIPANFIQLSQLVDSHTLSTSAAKNIVISMVKSGGDPQNMAKKMGLLQVSGEAELGAIIDQVVASNIEAVNDVKNGEDKAIGFLVGQVMKVSKGAANPETARKLLLEKIQK